MRWIALARYRYLVSLRKSTWLFVSILVVTSLAILFGSALLIPTFWYEQDATAAPQAAVAIVMVYILQVVSLGLTSVALGTKQQRAGESVKGDLMDTAPISSPLWFWGDALGIFAAQFAIHSALLPVMAVAFAISPFRVRTFLYLEAASLMALFFAACHASWLLRAKTSRWSRTRAARYGATFLILLFTTLITTTRWSDLLDGVTRFLDQTDPRGLQEIATAFDNPLLSILLLTVLYVISVAFCFRHSVRTMEEA